MSQKPFLLVILDGFGRGPEAPSNAIWKAVKPTFDYIETNFPMTNLQASGIAVGLPWGEEGNSEVGHLNLGSGRIVYQYMPRIIFAIRDGSFFTNAALVGAIEHAKNNNSALNIMGLISSGNVHSYIDHFYAVLELAKRMELQNVKIHAFTDGRDAPPKEGVNFLEKVKQKIKVEYPGARIVSVIGRYYAMDRDDRWELTEKAYNLITQNEGKRFKSPAEALRADYEKNLTDEFIEPAVIAEKDEVIVRADNNDSFIYINFREDSARQLTEAFVLKDFDKFKRNELKNIYFATMTRYKEGLDTRVAFEPLEIKKSLAEILSENNKKQLHIAETEKYAHITYFFNGGVEKPFPDEERILISSAQDYKFSEHPQMSAPEITNKILLAIRDKKYDIIIANYANADMVGHAGDYDATVKAIETLDNQIGSLLEAVLKAKGLMIITADHGNADEKRNPLTGEPHPEHSSNPVPFYLIAPEFTVRKSQEELERQRIEVDGILADVAPTVLELMNLTIPREMTGHSLLKLLKASPTDLGAGKKYS